MAPHRSHVRRSGTATPAGARRRASSLRRWLSGGLLAVAGLLGSGSPAAAAPEEAEAEVVPVEGATVRGRLGALLPGGVHLLADSGTRTWAPEDLREVRWPSRSERPRSPAPTLRVTLVTGDVLLGTFAGPTEDGLTLHSAAAGPLPIPFEVVRSLETIAADAGPCQDEAARHPASGEGDRIYLRTGDAYSGVITEAGAAGLSIETARGATHSVPWSDLLVAHVQGEPGGDGRVEGPAVHAEVESLDGSVFVTAAYPEGDARSLSFALRAAPKTTVRVPGEWILRVRTHGPRFAYASEIPWTGTFVPYYGAAEASEGEASGTSLLERWFAPRADRRPSGCPLRVGGVEHRRGFGVYAKTTIRIALDGGWTKFETGVGIDDEVLAEGAALPEGSPRGNVDVRVLGDDRVLWEAKGVKGGEPARATGPLDVTGVRSLVLEVGFGAEMNARDQADWLSPVLTRPARAAPQ